MTPFIQPYEYNLIHRELKKLLSAVYFVGDYRSFAAVKEVTGETIRALFAGNPDCPPALFDGIERIDGQKELNAWLERLQPYVIPFPHVTDAQLKRMFRKVKRLPSPDMSPEHRKLLTYMSWRDISTNTLFMLYPLRSEMVGLVCRYIVGETQKSNVCSLCLSPLSGTEVGLVVTNTRASYYQTVGNYMCLDGDACNNRITSVAGLEGFVTQVSKGRR